jgi:hypothetical protein
MDNDIEPVKVMAEKNPSKSVETLPPHIRALLKECPALEQAARYGVDIPLLLDNLRRPVSERIRRHQAALNAMNKLRKTKPV